MDSVTRLLAVEPAPQGGARLRVATPDGQELDFTSPLAGLLRQATGLPVVVDNDVFALTVAEPMMVGILGGGLSHIRLADGRHVVIDNLSTAPGKAPVAATCMARRCSARCPAC